MTALTRQIQKPVLVIFVLFFGTFSLWRLSHWWPPSFTPWLKHLPFFNKTITSVITAPSPTPTPPPPPTEIMAWSPYWDQTAVLDSFAHAAPVLNSLSPLFYHLNHTGQLTHYAEASISAILDLASQSGVLVIPTVGNDLDSHKVTTFLNNADHFAPAIDYLVTQARSHHFAGFDLDFESIPTQSATYYTDFLNQLHTALLDNQLLLTVAVHARTGSASDWELALSHDYQQIGALADQVRLMIYDFHYQDSEPGAVSPLDYVTSVIDYAKTVIPVDKIVVGLPLYGYDWPASGSGVSVTFSDINRLISAYQGQINRDTAEAVPVATYSVGDQVHQIWYEDSTSILTKMNLAKSHGISRFIFWSLGGEDPLLWPALQNSGDIVKQRTPIPSQ